MKISRATIIRTVLLLFAIINAVLQIFGKETLPFTDEEISEAISVLFLVATTISAWWKNNSFTKNAIKADEYKSHLDKESL